jgi:hypothetical protein
MPNARPTDQIRQRPMAVETACTAGVGSAKDDPPGFQNWPAPDRILPNAGKAIISPVCTIVISQNGQGAA